MVETRRTQWKSPLLPFTVIQAEVCVVAAIGAALEVPDPVNRNSLEEKTDHPNMFAAKPAESGCAFYSKFFPWIPPSLD